MFREKEYTEKKERFDWKGFLAKIILILILVFLLIWLLPMPNTKETDKKVDILLDSVYQTNMENMESAARGYFTIPKLPNNVGDKVTLTLGEMLEMELLLPFTDKDGNACSNDASYVEVEKLEKEYKLTTVLVCGEETKMTVEYFDLECGLACEDVCEKEEEPTFNEIVPTPQVNNMTEYRYKRVIPAGYWSDWSSWSETYVKGDDNKEMTQYMGKKWNHKLIYTYEYEKRTPVPDTCTTVTTSGGTSQNKTCEMVYKKVSSGSSYSCTKYRNETVTIPGECRTERYVISTETVRREDGTYDDVTKYGTKTVCDPDTTETVRVPYTDTCYSGADYDWVEECHYETVKNPDTTSTVCTPNPDKVETTWSEISISGWTATGKKKILRDEGSYSYSSWAIYLPKGYELHETRKLYSYRNYIVTEDYEYMWSTSNNIGNGWQFTGETRNKEIAIY